MFDIVFNIVWYCTRHDTIYATKSCTILDLDIVNIFCLILYKYCSVLYSLYNTCTILFLIIVWYCNVLFGVDDFILQYFFILVDIVIVNYWAPTGTAWLGCAILVMMAFKLHIQFKHELMLRKEAIMMCWLGILWYYQHTAKVTGQIVFELTWYPLICPNLPYA